MNRPKELIDCNTKILVPKRGWQYIPVWNVQKPLKKNIGKHRKKVLNWYVEIFVVPFTCYDPSKIRVYPLTLSVKIYEMHCGKLSYFFYWDVFSIIVIYALRECKI